MALKNFTSSRTKIGTTKKIIVERKTINAKREIKIPTPSPMRYLLSLSKSGIKNRLRINAITTGTKSAPNDSKKRNNSTTIITIESFCKKRMIF
jgi:hypothetical protein